MIIFFHSPNVVEVHVSHGNTQLGGDDFDERLMNHLAARFHEEYGLDPRGEHKALARLTRAAEQAKIALSTQPFVRVREEYLMELSSGFRKIHFWGLDNPTHLYTLGEHSV
jgi:molecular chaperone DnaK (HSP70)